MVCMLPSFLLAFQNSALLAPALQLTQSDVQFMLKGSLWCQSIRCLSPPTSTGPSPSLDILGLLQLRQEKTVAKRGEEATEGEKTRTRKDLKVPKWGETFFFSSFPHPESLQQIVAFDILSLSIDLFCSQWLRTSLCSLILEMILYQEYLLGGTKEKCFCALVYDKQVYISPSLTHWLWRYSDWGGWRSLTTATRKWRTYMINRKKLLQTTTDKARICLNVIWDKFWFRLWMPYVKP